VLINNPSNCLSGLKFSIVQFKEIWPDVGSSSNIALASNVDTFFLYG